MHFELVDLVLYFIYFPHKRLPPLAMVLEESPIVDHNIEIDPKEGSYDPPNEAIKIKIE